MVVAVGVGIYLGLSVIEWALVLLSIGFVITSELFNTAVEKICDEQSGGNKNEFVRHCKDIAAGAVLIAAVTALAVGIIIIIIPLFQRIF